MKIVEGSLEDSNLVKSTIAAGGFDAIVINSALPLNTQLRSLNFPLLKDAIVAPLTESGRLDSVKIVYLGGFFSVPPGESLGWVMGCLVSHGPHA